MVFLWPYKQIPVPWLSVEAAGIADIEGDSLSIKT
jgi:hypothetical protein